jgi:hypothetical protein
VTPGALIAVAAAGLSLLVRAGAGRAQEIVPFKLTGTEAYTALNYLGDTETSDQPDGGRYRSSQAGWRSELFVMTHSYVYHPNFLSLDIGGGPVLHLEDYGNEQGTTRASGLLYNFTARANVLRGKPYTGSVFYSHLNPTVSVAPGEVMTQESTRSGIDFSLQAPATPVPIQAEFVRSRTRGRSAERQVDDRTDQFDVSARRSFGGVGTTEVHYQASQQASASGSLGLPVQSSTSDHHALNLDTRLQWGDARQYDVSNLISMDRQHYAVDGRPVPAVGELRFVLDARAHHSDRLNSFGSYSFSRTSQGAIDLTVQDASAGLNYSSANIMDVGVAVRSNASRSQQFQARSQGFDGTLRRQWDFALGSFAANYGARLDRREQVASSQQVDVLGEGLTLTGSLELTLGHPHVIAGTTVVSNATRSQVFVEGVDYRLAVIGNETRIQRLLGGRILDGEKVLVDYAYDIGGTYALNQTDQNLGLTWHVGRYASVYLRRYDSRQRLVSGQPTFSLNDVDSKVAGATLEFPIRIGIALTAGGGYEHENRRETVTSYVRSSADFWLQTDEPLWGLGFVRVSAHRSRTDYSNDALDSDLLSRDLRYWWRNSLGMDITAGFTAETDRATLLPRQRREASAGATWQKRKLSISANLVRTYEAQARIERRRTSVQLQLRRDL